MRIYGIREFFLSVSSETEIKCATRIFLARFFSFKPNSEKMNLEKLII